MGSRSADGDGGGRRRDRAAGEAGAAGVPRDHRRRQSEPAAARPHRRRARRCRCRCSNPWIELAPPTGAVSTPPEYAVNEGLLISWGSFNSILTELAVGITTGDPDAIVYIVVTGPSQQASATADPAGRRRGPQPGRVHHLHDEHGVDPRLRPALHLRGRPAGDRGPRLQPAAPARRCLPGLPEHPVGRAPVRPAAGPRRRQLPPLRERRGVHDRARSSTRTRA